MVTRNYNLQFHSIDSTTKKPYTRRWTAIRNIQLACLKASQTIDWFKVDVYEGGSRLHLESFRRGSQIPNYI